MTMEKSYSSCYDKNRSSYRKDKNHYVYQEWVETNKNQGYYKDHVLTVGEDGVTLELLDYLQALDNDDVQSQEDGERYRELLTAAIPACAKSPEEVLCGEEEFQSQMAREFDKKVRPHLSDEQMDFIYEHYGAGKTLDEIAEGLPLNEEGSPISRRALLGIQKRIIAKVKKYMPQD